MAGINLHSLPSGEKVMLPGAKSTRLKPPKKLTTEESAKIREAKRSRDKYEKANPDRYGDALSGVIHATGMTVHHVYHEMGWGDTGVGPRSTDVQLPGMADPNAAPRPQKWSEMTDEQRAHTVRALAMHGTSIEQMTKDFGAQLDQAYLRAHRLGAEEPYAKTFYSTGEPRKVVEKSARDLGIPGTEHAVYNALTSPNSKFSVGSGEKKRYPNDEAATAAVRHADTGGTHETAGSIRLPSGKKPEAYGANIAKAVHVRNQVRTGTPMPEAVSPSGRPIWNEDTQKTGAYANSWSDTHPQFFVSDVHSGGGGMLPHLGFDKPVMTDKEGNPRVNNAGRPMRDKSEREKAIQTVPHFHAAAHEAAERATAARGIGSIREAQAAQWGEEQLRRGGRHGVTEANAYPSARHDRGHFEQGLLFE